MGRIPSGTADPRQAAFLFRYRCKKKNTDGSTDLSILPCISQMALHVVSFLNAPLATAEQLASIGKDKGTTNPFLGDGPPRVGTRTGKTARVYTTLEDTAGDFTAFKTVEFQVPKNAPNNYVANYLRERNADGAAPCNGLLNYVKLDQGRQYSVSGAPVAFPDYTTPAP